MRKVFVLALFACFALDVAADSLNAACDDPIQTQACHACVCSHHAMDPQPHSSQKFAPLAPKKVIAYESSFAERLFDKSIFHPPRLTA